MLRHRILVVPLLTGAIVLASSCSDDSTQPTPTTDRLDPAKVALQQGSPDDPVALARGVAGFGGFFVDEHGTPTIYLKDATQRGAAEKALTPWFSSRGRGVGTMQVRKADFAWADLDRWFTQASAEALRAPGVVFTDADEALNRVHIGVEHAAAAAQARSALARLGIPAAAVTIEVTAPIKQLATLRGSVRPVVAGVQINFPGFLCSVGFNATRGGVSGFVTASHCTTTQGGVESTPYWQPLQSVNPTQIGTETVDPAYTTGGGCPSGRRCRRSDASFARYINSTQNTLGAIARTSSTNKRNLTIAGSWTITSDATSSNFTVGETVNKVGRTTGWSQGPVSSTCVNVNVSGSSITQLCQTIVSASVGGGDSGSDVFSITSGTNVRLDGVLWGGSSNGRTFVFSPLANVTGEVGALTTH
ncbi:MAG: hypothetical protein ACJ8DC_08115 [Gemmatimonadales bacterium]